MSVAARRKRKATEISELSEQAIACRETGHWWRRDRVEWLKKNPKGKNVTEERVLVCDRCGAERVQTFEISAILNRFVPISSPRVRYPEGYLLKGRRLSRAELMYYLYQQQQKSRQILRQARRAA